MKYIWPSDVPKIEKGSLLTERFSLVLEALFPKIKYIFSSDIRLFVQRYYMDVKYAQSTNSKNDVR